MKRPKNLEALFLAAALLATVASYATADVPVRAATVTSVASKVTVVPGMQVVVIKGQRLSAAQKAAL
jgi:hypothetical protein